MLSFTFILIAAVFLTGIINRMRSLLSGRKGQRLFQHIYNVRLLLRKDSVYSPTTGLLFRVVPAIYLGATLVAAALVPMGGYYSLIHFNGDMVMFAYLLALSRLSLILGALDTGSSFEGMGASREALYGALIEPAMFFVFGTLALMTGRTSFSDVFSAMSATSPEMIIVTLLLAYIILKILLVEAGRIPVDDTRTHLELTMIHEVMILDYCGIDLALINIASWIRTAALATLAAGTIASTIGYAGVSAATIMILVACIGIFIGFIESFRARNRLDRNATYILATTSLGLFAFLLVYIIKLKINL